VSTLTSDDLDWLGLHATRLNGHLLRTIFRDVAHPVIITNPDEVKDVPRSAKLIVAAGYRPGASTDLRAVQIAHHLGATRLINLSNIDYAYDKDPKKYKDSVPIKTIDWTSFRALLPTEWDPGLSSPFDPIAAREAEACGIEVAIINGAKLKQVEKYVTGEKFVGTRIM
jgi:uridylate kinase